MKKMKKNMCLVIGAILFSISGFLILYLALQLLNSGMIDFSKFLNIGIFIGSPFLFGTAFIAYGLEERKKRKFVKSVEVIAFIGYLLLLIGVLFRGTREHLGYSGIGIAEYFRLNSNLIPFKTIGNYIAYFINNTINKNIIIGNLLGNLLMFVPMGFFLPCLIKWFTKWNHFLITIILVLVGVEFVQLFLYLGVFDIDDIILNFIGAFVVFALIKNKRLNTFLKKIYILG